VNLEILPDADGAAQRAAAWIALQAREAVAARGRFTLAVSGGKTPGRMLRALAAENVPWREVQVFQVDERVAPAGDPDRNLTLLRESLLGRVPILPGNLHAMPVEEADLAAACAAYARGLSDATGAPAVLDVVHLGLGTDGHTASLVPGDPVLEERSADVAMTRPYAGRRRMTLTYPVLDRARHVLWLVTGADKAPVMPRLLSGDPAIPAGRVRADHALALADRAAAANLGIDQEVPGRR
jgi:6-phosphogluconolactonase